jgi:superfamily II DNA or RNA helicase
MGAVSGFEAELPNGRLVRIVAQKPAADLGDCDLLVARDARTLADIERALLDKRASWIKPVASPAKSESVEDARARCANVRGSWKGAFQLREAEAGAPGDAGLGLRRPQVGAVHAALAHATRSTAPATIVMPTGTGKTETMLALTVSRGFEKVLVVVPSDALREQIAEKFRTLGILKAQLCLDSEARYPVVAQLEHIPKTIEDVDDVFDRANVVVTTMSVAGRAFSDIQTRIAERANVLFIDEAHHIGARTWSNFRSFFSDATEQVPVLQFTATPFREDGRRVDGEFIYTYPLKKAQTEHYFKPIRFEAIFGLDKDDADLAIVTKVGAVLATDLAAGLDHLVMARCNSIERAKALHALYTARLGQHRPVLVHSQLRQGERKAALDAIRQKQSRIVVCVDMLGEGFDLPELKIAALHDHHKSVAVTIQFVGRFTRTASHLGDATVIANTGVEDLDRTLAKLYAEDADWNTLVEGLSSAHIERQVRRAELFKGFTGDLTQIPLQTLEPRMSVSIYRTAATEWDPWAIEDLFAAGEFVGMKVNASERIAVFVTRTEEMPQWTTSFQATDVTWDLFMVHWDEDAGLLYINSSAKGPFDRIAKASVGDAERIQGEDVFRSLSGFKRLIVRNLGLTHHQGRGVRFSMFMGVDVTEGLSTAKAQGRIKNNVFGAGFLDGLPATRGCSAKGKFWSLAPVRDLNDWTSWCHEIGAMVIDPTISTDDVFASAMKPRVITERPDAVPVAIHWPESLILQVEDRVTVKFGTTEAPFAECDIELVTNSRTGPLTFRVVTTDAFAQFEIDFENNGAIYRQASGASALIRVAGKERSLSDFFGDDAPHIDFGDGSLLIYSHLYELPVGVTLAPFPPERIEAWDWAGTDIRVESQGEARKANSIQRRVIDKLKAVVPPYDIIFDDDGKGEVADVVAIRVAQGVIQVEQHHCKYSSGSEPGARLKDLYEVCGQAQKGVRWRDRPHRMFQHLLRREKLRTGRGQSTRFERGNAANMSRLRASWQEYRYEYSATIVQPGLSRAAIGDEGLHLLAGVETYLMDTRAMKLGVIGSK